MQGLSTREKLLLLICFIVVFGVANLFAIRYAKKNWKGQDAQIAELTNQLKDLELWLEDKEDADRREQWLTENIPHEASMAKAQGDLVQSLQDDLFERNIKIEKQILMEPEENDSFREVAVSLTLRGEEKSIIQWLITLQGASKFQVIKRLELKLDTKSKEELPQSICEIVLARWFSPFDQKEATQEIKTDTETSESSPSPQSDKNLVESN